jgi:hypothetical protein
VYKRQPKASEHPAKVLEFFTKLAGKR